MGTIMKNILLAFALALLTACTGMMQTKPAQPPAKDVLYRELGGTEGITRTVDLFLQRVNADARINTLFAKVDHNDLRRLLIEQLCQISGGPCTYTGRSMEEAHSGLNLTDKDFDNFVGDLTAGMNDAKLPKTTQKKLLALLSPMRKQVVGQ
ncbi:MAG TPA: group 1 truncated hemoglobin [Rudaea sp.]|jgi:hemoglobin|nr:group 1 truncated hemoglobin [Rudaea sp.]